VNRPNVLLILADDMGFSDIGCYGSEIATPNLDSLAAGGIRLTQLYTCARCCPTRASLLTGLHPHQTGVGHMVNNRGLAAYQGYLNDRCVTIAEALRSAGYRTMMSGKWHVGGAYPPNDPAKWSLIGQEGHPLPVQRGFECHYGTLGGAGSYYNPPSMVHDDKLIKAEGEEFYYTDAISDQAVAMIRQAAQGGQPFFCYVAYTTPHWPLHALPEDIAKYRGRYSKGWDAIRTERHERLKAMGILDPRWPISPRDAEAPPWEQLANKAWEDMRMAVYAAQIDRMDQGIGRIMAALRKLGVADNTLVMFLSDNGGCAEFLAEDADKTEKFRYNIPTRKGQPIHVGNAPKLMPGPETTFMSYDLPWANVSNAPFRLYKHWVHEGGISTPMIAHWPATIPAGQIAHQPCHVVDIMATCLDAAGVAYPSEFAGHQITPLEGEGLMPVFRGRAWSRSQEICWEHEGNRAVRQGNWKLVSKHPGDWELYDTERDRTELNDLAGKNRAKVKELEAVYERWAQRCGVAPWDQLRTRKP